MKRNETRERSCWKSGYGGMGGCNCCCWPWVDVVVAVDDVDEDDEEAIVKWSRLKRMTRADSHLREETMGG